MTLNPYFIHGTTSEQRLIQDLVNEQLRMFGQDVVYMPRKFITEKKIIKELLVSKFDDSFHIEAYIANSDGFGGQGDILSKFGVRSTDEITFIISKERYEDFITPFIQLQSDIKLATRPQEGDLIYFPLDNSLFEIKYVEGKRPFYQLNNLYVYELKCELFEYEDEIIDTGLDLVDKTIQNFGYITTLKMTSSTARNAVVEIELANDLYPSTFKNSVSSIEILNGGYGFKSTPEVIIDPPEYGGVQASAVATLKSIGNNSTIDQIYITNPGIGYSVEPRIYIRSNSGDGFIGRCNLSQNSLGPVSIIDQGSGYSTVPILSISTSPTGQNAEVIPIINSLGNLVSVRYINSGAGYTEAPTISISSPSELSTGNYRYNEIIRGVSTGTSAYVKEWDFDERILKVGIINGNFALGESVVGAGATYTIFSINSDDIYDSYSSNEEIQKESDQIIDFSEVNPFGEF